MLDSSKQIIHREKDGVLFFQFPLLDDMPLVHGFSTKLGGVSCGEFSTMNLSFTRGDKREDVMENYRRFVSAVGCGTEELVLTDQVHGTEILRVGKSDRGEVFAEERFICNTDGLITDEPGVVLMTFFADCVPLMFYDPVHHAVGNAHSGWRGTVGRMGEKMVQRMHDEFGTAPEDVLVVVGPSICKACYEVSADVVLEFQNAFHEKHWDNLYDKKSENHYQLDLWKANEMILLEAGVKPEHIQVCGVCTNENPDILFSHRYTLGKRGNLAAVIGLKEKS